jgi:hypothetical protein
MGDRVDEPDDRCWCGEPNPLYSDDLDEACGGTGERRCYCGGDVCVCHNHGAVECTGCWDCDGDPDDEDDNG